MSVKIIQNIDVKKVWKHLNTKWLVRSLWQMKDARRAAPKLAAFKRSALKEKIFKLEAAYLIFNDEKAKFKLKAKGYRQLALQLVTVGSGAIEYGQKLYKEGRYSDYFLMHGFAAATTEALAQMTHLAIEKELGLRKGSTRRISPGYPVWPELSSQKEICKLLRASKIGIGLTETFELVPEYSTSAMVIQKI